MCGPCFTTFPLSPLSCPPSYASVAVLLKTQTSSEVGLRSTAQVPPRSVGHSDQGFPKAGVEEGSVSPRSRLPSCPGQNLVAPALGITRSLSIFQSPTALFHLPRALPGAVRGNQRINNQRWKTRESPHEVFGDARVPLLPSQRRSGPRPLQPNPSPAVGGVGDRSQNSGNRRDTSRSRMNRIGLDG